MIGPKTAWEKVGAVTIYPPTQQLAKKISIKKAGFELIENYMVESTII